MTPVTTISDQSGGAIAGHAQWETLAVSGVVGGLSTSVVARLWCQTDQMAFPFIWCDVALVSFLSALPFAVAVAALLRGRISRIPLTVLATVILGAVVFLSIVTSTDDVTDLRPSLLAAGAILRTLMCLGATIAIALGITAAVPSPPPSGDSHQMKSWGWMSIFGAVVAFLLPSVYIQARCHHDAARAADLLEQSRLGEAIEIMQRLLVLSPRVEWGGTSLRQLAAETKKTVREVEMRIADPLSLEATDQERLVRARDLAILGQTQGALAILNSAASLTASPDASNLRGTIYESRGEWELGRESYEHAQQAWQNQPPSAERTAGQVRTITGLAFCHRKLGRNAQAERAYIDLLRLSPTADSHFLLARFYDGTEQTNKAHIHARQAINLAPNRYQEAGQRLIDNLTTRHFGCLNVFRSDP